MNDAAATTPAPAASLTLRELVARIIKTAEQPVAIADVKKRLKGQGIAVGGRKGYKDADVRKLMGENAVRVFSAAWKNAPKGVTQ